MSQIKIDMTFEFTEEDQEALGRVCGCVEKASRETIINQIKAVVGIWLMIGYREHIQFGGKEQDVTNKDS